MNTAARWITLTYIFLRLLNPNNVGGWNLNPEYGFNLLVDCLPFLALSFLFFARLRSGEGVKIPHATFFLFGLSICAIGALTRSAFLLSSMVHTEFLLCLTALALLIFNCGELKKTILPAVMGLVFAGVVYSIIQYIYFTTTPPEQAVPLESLPPTIAEQFRARYELHDVSGISFYSNSWAAMLCPAIVILAVRLIRSKGSSRIASAFALLALVLTTYFTGSKGGWIAAIVGTGWAIYSMLTLEKPLKFYIVPVISAVIIGIALLPFITDQKSMEGRKFHWQTALNVVPDNVVVGSGLSTFGEYYNANKGETVPETKFAHNDFLQLACETGIAGAAVYALFLIYIFHKSSRSDSAIPTTGGVSFPIAAAVFLACAVGSYLVFGRFNEIGGTIAGPILVSAGFACGYRMAMSWESVPSVAIAGIVAAFALHSCVDFLFYDYGLVVILMSIAFSYDSLPAMSGQRWICAAAAAVSVCLIALLAWLGIQTVIQQKTIVENMPVISDSAPLEERVARVQRASTDTEAYEAFKPIARRINLDRGESRRILIGCLERRNFFPFVTADIDEFERFVGEMFRGADRTCLNPDPFEAVLMRGSDDAIGHFRLIRFDAAKTIGMTLQQKEQYFQTAKALIDKIEKSIMRKMEQAMAELKRLRPRRDGYYYLMSKLYIEFGECMVIFGASESIGVLVDRAYANSVTTIELYPTNPHYNLQMAKCLVYKDEQSRAKEFLARTRKYNAKYRNEGVIPNHKIEFVESLLK